MADEILVSIEYEYIGFESQQHDKLKKYPVELPQKYFVQKLFLKLNAGTIYL